LNRENYMMRQQEIEFFWPLTEQMPLELNYSDCEKPRLTTMLSPVHGAIGYLTTNGAAPQWSTSLVASNMTIDVGTTVFKVEEHPPLYRRALYKLMNIRWEKK
jgi:hypothetical protein